MASISEVDEKTRRRDPCPYRKSISAGRSPNCVLLERAMLAFLTKFLLVARSRLGSQARLQAEILVLRQRVLVVATENSESSEMSGVLVRGRRSAAGMLKLERSVISVVARRFRSRAVVELENLDPRHQLRVLRRQRPGEVASQQRHAL